MSGYYARKRELEEMLRGSSSSVLAVLSLYMQISDRILPTKNISAYLVQAILDHEVSSGLIERDKFASSAAAVNNSVVHQTG